MGFTTAEKEEKRWLVTGTYVSKTYPDWGKVEKKDRN